MENLSFFDCVAEGYVMKKVNNLYLCEECGLLYEDFYWADKCEKWCKEHNSCNVEITRHAIPKTDFLLE